MKDAVITVRLPAATRRRLEALARREGRSLSQQVERLLEVAMGTGALLARDRREARVDSLADSLKGGRVPTLQECLDVRRHLSESLLQRGGGGGKRRR